VQGQQEREFSAMRQGVVDMLCGAPINWAGTVRALGVEVHMPTAAEAKVWQIATQRTCVLWQVQTSASLAGKIEQIVEKTRKA